MQNNYPYSSVITEKEKHIATTHVTNEGLEDKLVEVMCIICNNIPLTPTACKACHNIFCKECIKAWLDQGKGCPLRCNYEEAEISGDKRQLLSKLNLRCASSEKGCQAILPYSDYVKHMLFECDVNTYKCNGCTSTGNKRVILMHIKVCEKVEEPCPFCKAAMKRESISQHLKACDLKVIECPSCSQLILQKEVEEHSNICNVVFECKYCKMKFDKDNNEKDHCKDECFSYAMKDLKHQVHQLNVGLEQSHKKIEELKSENYALKLQLEEKNTTSNANPFTTSYNPNPQTSTNKPEDIFNQFFGPGSNINPNPSPSGSKKEHADPATAASASASTDAQQDGDEKVQCKNQ
jgi:hypothetical protein